MPGRRSSRCSGKEEQKRTAPSVNRKIRVARTLGFLKE